MPDAKLPAVPETILKRRKRQAENRANRAKLAVKAKVDKRKKRVAIFKRAEKYAKEYQDQERDEIRLQRDAKKDGKVLQLLRLRQINNGVFIKMNKATTNMLRICEPYITYGCPNLKAVRDLVYKRGFVKVDGNRTA